MDAILDGLRRIADNLDSTSPDHLMTAGQRHANAYIMSTITHPHDPPAAEELERQLLLRMPWVDGRQVTRGEYARELRNTNGSV